MWLLFEVFYVVVLSFEGFIYIILVYEILEMIWIRLFVICGYVVGDVFVVVLSGCSNFCRFGVVGYYKDFFVNFCIICKDDLWV